MTTLDDIRKQARQLRDKVVPSGSTMATPVISAAREYGYNVTEFNPTEKTQGVSGAVNHSENRIYVNATEAATRKRFTIAHEIGHVVLHKDQGNTVDYRADINYGAGGAPKEREASAFAAELLMPRPIFEALWNAYGGDVDEVAAQLQVSKQAAKIQTETLLRVDAGTHRYPSGSRRRRP